LKDNLPNLDEIRRAQIKSLNLASKKYRSSDKGQVAIENYNNSLKEAYYTNKEFREKRLQYSKQYTADGKQAAVRAKHRASKKYKITEAAYRASEAQVRARSEYQKSDKNKLAQAKYTASKKGKASIKRRQNKVYVEKKLARI
jgi:hypothetical protein